MHFIAPDVLAEARGLSPVISGVGVGIGVLIWLFGWRWHRFWVVAAVTVGGGLIGLQTGRASGGHILAMGVLLAISAGLLALELSRILTFAAAGMSVWLAASAIFPKGQELWVAFLVGGLLGVLLYRFWTMLLTSFAGILLVGHAGICLVCELARFDGAAFAQKNSMILNGVVLALTVLGLVLQSLLERLLERWRKNRKKRQEDRLREKILASAPKPSAPSILDRLLFRKRKSA